MSDTPKITLDGNMLTIDDGDESAGFPIPPRPAVELDSAVVSALNAFWAAWQSSGISSFDPLAIGAPLQATRHLATDEGGHLIEAVTGADDILRYRITPAGCAIIGKPYPGETVAESTTAPLIVNAETGEIARRPFAELNADQRALICTLWQTYGGPQSEPFSYPSVTDVDNLRHLVDAYYLHQYADGTYEFMLQDDELATLCTTPTSESGTSPLSVDGEGPGVRAISDEFTSARAAFGADEFASRVADAVGLIVDAAGSQPSDELSALRAALAKLEAERDALKATLQRQSNMLLDAVPDALPPVSHKPRIEVKTLRQKLGGEEKRAKSDEELAGYLNDGWMILNFTDHSGSDIGSDFRRVTLQRVKPADPARQPAPAAAAATIGEITRVDRVIDAADIVAAAFGDDEPEAAAEAAAETEPARRTLADQLINPATMPHTAFIRQYGAAAYVRTSLSGAQDAGQAAYQASMEAAAAAAARRAAQPSPFALPSGS